MEHINITLDFGDGNRFDLRVPTHQPIDRFITHVSETIGIGIISERCCIKIENKGIMLRDDDILANFPITDGDILRLVV